jgi:hypothetical protein
MKLSTSSKTLMKFGSAFKLIHASILGFSVLSKRFRTLKLLVAVDACGALKSSDTQSFPKALSTCFKSNESYYRNSSAFGDFVQISKLLKAL